VKKLQKITLLAILLISNTVSAQELYKKATTLMGVDFELSVAANNKIKGNYYLNEAVNEIIRLEKMISSWDLNSQTSKINKNAGIKPIRVNKELFNLIKRSIRISKLTDGFFDISFASIDKVWFFNKSLTKLPSSEAIKKSVDKINYKNIILNETNLSVYLKEKGMKIGFGAIGKGFAAEKAKEKLIRLGAKAGLINASGDITCWGEHPKYKKWNIAISNPNKKNSPIAWFKLSNSAVVTSGNYEKFVIINNKRYSHIIDPKTGWPVNELKSVTIFCSNAELADALATAVFVIGTEKGINLINQLKDVECLLIDSDNKKHKSNNLLTTYN